MSYEEEDTYIPIQHVSGHRAEGNSTFSEFSKVSGHLVALRQARVQHQLVRWRVIPVDLDVTGARRGGGDCEPPHAAKRPRRCACPKATRRPRRASGVTSLYEEEDTCRYMRRRIQCASGVALPRGRTCGDTQMAARCVCCV